MADTNKVVLITGAGGGLGKALTLIFLSKGWRVIATDLREPQYTDSHSISFFESQPDITNRFWSLKMDITLDESIAEVFALLKAKGIKLDIIINNAGIDDYFLLSEAAVSRFKRIFEVNVFGGYRVNQVFLPILQKPGGRIIHISSESLNLTMPFMPYPLTKKLVEGYAKAIRQELKFRGIDVVIIRPGAIGTELLKTVSGLSGKFENAEETDSLRKAFHSFCAQASKEIGRIVTPEKVAESIFRISNVSRPKAVYLINNMIQLKIITILPFWLMEFLVRKRLMKKNS